MFDKVPLSPILSFLQRKINLQADRTQNLREETELDEKKAIKSSDLKFFAQVNRGDLFCKKKIINST